MLLRMFIRDKHQRERISHIMAGILILVHAYDQFDTGHGSPAFFLVAGIVFLLIAFLHPLLEKKFRWIDSVFFMIEGILSLVVSLDYFHTGRKALPLAYLLVAAVQFFAAYRKYKKRMLGHHPEKKDP